MNAAAKNYSSLAIRAVEPTFRTGADVAIEIVDSPKNKGGSDDLFWVILRQEGEQLIEVESGELRFTADNPVQYVHPRRSLPTGAYDIRVWAINDGEGDNDSLAAADPRPGEGNARRSGVTAFTAPGGFADPLVNERFTVGAPGQLNVVLGNEKRDVRIDVNDPCASYRGFADYIAGRLEGVAASAGVGGNVGTYGVFGAFGGENYRLLKEAAFDFAAECRCTSVFDLAPPGYEQARKLEQGISLRSESYLPCVELIWNYWQEEGMLVQTLNLILARFQNRVASRGVDPLARFDISPLLPLRNLLWGYAGDEQNRLSVRRRAAEYEYEYGLTLIGKAVPATRTLVERRSGFLAAFHAILHQAHVYFKEVDDLTVTADAFPLYQSLRECHLVLANGSHNQYGEMAIAARAEMLVMQYLLAQPPMREFLGGRPMTPYPEPWMDRVDTMKTIQGWVDTSVLHFHDLATIGEKLVLTIRLGNWADTAVGATQAATWADAFRPLIQKYCAAYRAVTGVDLAREVNTALPSELIARRAHRQPRRA